MARHVLVGAVYHLYDARVTGGLRKNSRSEEFRAWAEAGEGANG